MSQTLTEEEKDFIHFWETEGPRRRKWTFMLKKNFHKGLILSIPIVLFVFLMGTKHRTQVNHAELIIIIICIVLISSFYALFRGYVSVDRMETHYKILKLRESKTNSANTNKLSDKNPGNTNG